MYNTPALQAPGAGLPFIEALYLKYFLMPRLRGNISWQKSNVLFRKETDRILELHSKLSPADAARPVLIKRIAGIEDSSRFWSVNDTMEHLVKAVDGMAAIISTLSEEQNFAMDVRIADLKPTGKYPNIVKAFQETMARAEKISKDPGTSHNSIAIHLHPWMGHMNTHGWHTLMAVHQGLHRRQIELIIQGLK